MNFLGYSYLPALSLISLFISRRVSNPIEEMKRGADRFAYGDLGHRLHKPYILELAGLAEAMNRMAYQLEDRIMTVKNQKNEYKAVLSSMKEGVIGIDSEDNILNINQAALEIFNAVSYDLKGKSIQEVVRYPDFIKFIQNAVSREESSEEDIEIRPRGDRIINTRTAPLRNSVNEHIGTLIVLNDVTHIRNLENIRRDFVANLPVKNNDFL